MRKDQAITKYQRFKRGGGGVGLTSLAVKLLITKRQISKECLEGVDKWCLGNQWRNLGKMPATPPGFQDQLQSIHTSKPKKFTTPLPLIAKIIFHYNRANFFFQNLHITKNSKPHLPYKWSPTQA